MKTLMKIGALVFIILLPTMCQGGSKLTNDEAKKIITQEAGYPKIVESTYGPIVGRPLENDLRSFLVNEGYLKGSTVNELTEKGKKIFQYINGSTYFLYTHEEYISSIDEILIDEKSDIAHIKYTVAYKPLSLEPFLTQWNNIFRKYNARGATIHERPPVQKQIILKKYDKGWKIPR